MSAYVRKLGAKYGVALRIMIQKELGGGGEHATDHNYIIKLSPGQGDKLCYYEQDYDYSVHTLVQ